jgi:hypothetical protein
MAFGLGRGGRELTLRIVSDTAAINKSTAATAKGISTINKQISGLGATFAGFFAFNSIVGFLQDASEAARADARETALLNREIENLGISAEAAAPAIDAMIAAYGRMGVEDTKVRDGLKRSIQLTDDFTSAQFLTAQALDVSAALGIDVAEAADLITKAVSGGSGAARALRTLGIEAAVAKTPLQTLTAIVAKYAGATAAAATEQDKLQVQTDEFIESIGAKWNDFFNTSMVQLQDYIFLLSLGFDYDKYYSIKSIGPAKAIDEGTSEGVMAAREQRRAMTKEVDDIMAAIGKSIEESAPEIRFPKLQFSEKSDWVDDYIASMTAYLEKPSTTKRLRDFFKNDLPDLLRGQKPNSAKTQAFVSTTVQGMLDGTIKPSDLKGLDRKLREQVTKAFEKAKNDMKTANAKTMDTAIRDAIPDSVTKAVGVNVVLYPLSTKWRTSSGYGGSDGNPNTPWSLPPSQQPAASVSPTIIINTGVGDPVAIGREVSNVLHAYQTRVGA